VNPATGVRRTVDRMDAAVTSLRRRAGAALAAAVLAVVVWRVGTGPFVAGLRAVDGRALLAAVAIGFVTTVCGAWRWTIVARGVGLRLSLPVAVAAYYRALFLNLTLPGGVAGDVHRGVRHGRDVHDLGLALRAVVWERAAGQVLQVVLTIAILTALPSPVQRYMPLVVLAAGFAAVALVLVGRGRPGAGRFARARSAVVADIRNGVLRRNALPAIVLASTVAVLGYALTFLIAARTAGATAPIPRLLPLALLAMLAMVLPSVAGWGPKEGVTAWVFSAAGLGAGRGAATAVVYGVMTLVAFLPGAIVLVTGWLLRRRAPVHAALL
jgi:glycosyltransferase 2 family protein